MEEGEERRTKEISPPHDNYRDFNKIIPMTWERNGGNVFSVSGNTQGIYSNYARWVILET